MAIRSSTLLLNGTAYDIPFDVSAKKYRKAISAPGKSSFPKNGNRYAMVLKITDEAGNVTVVDKNDPAYGALMLLRVLEKNPPVITMTKPSEGAYAASNSVQIQFDVTDDDSGVNPESISMKIDSSEAVSTGITKTVISNGYRCIYTAELADGAHTIKINAEDNDGNGAVQKETAFTIDTVPPELNVPVPSEQMLTNKSGGSISGTTNDAASGLVTVNITLNGADQGSVAVNADGTFTKAVTWRKGTNTAVIKAADQAGNFSTVSRTVVYDPDAPVIVNISIAPNPVDAGGEFVITVEAVD